MDTTDSDRSHVVIQPSTDEVTVVRVQPDAPAMPPEYDEVITSTRYPVLHTESSVIEADPHSVGSEGSQPLAWRLKFVDFTPHLVGTRMHLISFDKLVDRANTWLQSNKHVDVRSCETVTWCAEDVRSLNDTDVVTTKLKKGLVKKTHMMRGLRLWLTPKPDSVDECTTLGVRDFTPETLDVKSLENFDIKTLTRTANSKIWESPLSGDIISIETVFQPTRADPSHDKLPLKVKDTYWTDGARIDRKYVPILRVFYALGTRNLNVEIGLMDIIPRMMRQSGRNRYEDLDSLTVRASEWAVNQPHITVANIQTLTYRRRGFSQGLGYPVFWSSVDSEEACIRCIRIAYSKPRTMVTLRVFQPEHYSIQKRTFAPRKSALSVDDHHTSETQPDDLRYQGFTRTVDEVSAWVDKSSIEILSVETLRHQVVNGKYQTSPDSSLVRPCDDKTREMISLVRIYIKATSQSGLSLSGPASFFNSISDRPFWSRPVTSSDVSRPTRSRRCRHLLLVLVLMMVIVIVAIVIVIFVGRTQGWIQF